MGKTLGERISEMLRKQGIQQKELAKPLCHGILPEHENQNQM